MQKVFTDMAEYYALALVAVLLSVVAQLLLKRGATYATGYKNFFRLFLNPWSLSAYAIFFFVLMLMVFVLRHLPLRTMVFILPANYILITLLSTFVLKEPVNRWQWMGLAIILAGMAVFNWNYIIG